MKSTLGDGQVWSVELQAKDVLKPCPFCGDGPIELHHTWTASYWLVCDGCGAEMHDYGAAGSPDSRRAHIRSAQRVLRQWNTRSYA